MTQVCAPERTCAELGASHKLFAETGSSSQLIQSNIPCPPQMVAWAFEPADEQVRFHSCLASHSQLVDCEACPIYSPSIAVAVA